MERIRIENLPNETWRDVRGYEGIYMVSNMGRVKSINHENKNLGVIEEYLFKGCRKGKVTSITLTKNRKRNDVSLCKLVAETFIPQPVGKEYVIHIDNNFDNNQVKNLRWVNKRYKLEHEKEVTHESLVEKWKDIKGYEGIYQVSDHGRIKLLQREYSNLSGRKMVVRDVIKEEHMKGSKPYVRVKINNIEKEWLIEKIVAETFIPHSKELTKIIHLDRDNSNNKVSNLRWASNEKYKSFNTPKKHFSMEMTITFKKDIKISADSIEDAQERLYSLFRNGLIKLDIQNDVDTFECKKV